MPNSDMTLLGFDFGTKRIGTAVGQTVTRTASPLIKVTVHQGQPDWPAITKLFKEWQPSACVVGLPLNMDDSEQAITKAAKRFAKELQARFQVDTHLVDERLSTKAAKDEIFSQGGYRALEKQSVDCIAAKLILEAWLAQY